MASNKPTLLLVPGAYHDASCYNVIKPKLEALSYPVVDVKPATLNAKSTSVSPNDDVAELLRIMIPLFDAGKEITIVCHSYSGVPAYLSTEGQSIAERAKAGKKGGVRSVVFMCAFAILKAGNTFNDQNILSDASWVKLREEDNLVECTEWAKTCLYEDLSEEERESRFKQLGTMPLYAFLTPIEKPIQQVLKVPSLYLITEKDRVCSPVVQKQVIDAIPGMQSVSLDCGHSPFLSHPDATVDAIVKGAAL